MGRPATRPTKLKDGFYIEVKNPGSSAVVIRRETREQMILAVEEYSRTKEVNILGEMKDDKWVN
jgi:isocitrate dehydrogenase